MGFLALLIPLTPGLPIVVLVITVPVITVPVITVPVITVPVLVVAVTIVIMVIVATITVMIVVMTKQCVRGRRHRFFGNVYRGVKCLAGGFERVKRGSNSVTSHPEGILDYFTCKALVIPVMTVMSAADSDQRGHHSE